MNLHQRYLVALMPPLLLSLSLSACKQETPPPPPPTEVTVVTLSTANVTLTRELSGRVTASQVAEIRPQISGIIQQRLFEEGAQVEVDQPLYQLEDASYQAEVASAKAALMRADVTLAAAKLKAKRYRELAAAKLISVQDNEDAITALNQAEADVATARAALQRSDVTLNYARIVSPIAGRIGKSSVTRGALVTTNQEAPLATVYQLDPIYVDVTQSAREWLELRQLMSSGKLRDADLPVELSLEDGSRYTQSGKLAFSETSVDPTTGSYALRITVPNPDGILLPGMYLRATVSEGVRPNALTAPQQGISRTPKGSASAMVVNSEGQVEARQVEVSRAIGDRWLVESGLQAGDRLIVEGLQKIGPGMPVNVVEQGEQSPSATQAQAN